MKPTRNLNECSEIIRARGGSEPEPARQVTRPRVAEEQGPGCLHAHGTSGWCPHSGDRAVLLESHRHLDTWPGTKEVDRGLSPERNTGEGPGDFQHENQGSEPARPDPRTTHPAPHIPRLPRVSPSLGWLAAHLRLLRLAARPRLPPCRRRPGPRPFGCPAKPRTRVQAAGPWFHVTFWRRVPGKALRSSSHGTAPRPVAGSDRRPRRGQPSSPVSGLRPRQTLSGACARCRHTWGRSLCVRRASRCCRVAGGARSSGLTPTLLEPRSRLRSALRSARCVLRTDLITKP